MDYNELQLKAATDPEFRARLLADPAGELAKIGVELPDGMAVRVIESTPEEIVMSIPAAVPEGTEVDEDALADAAAGTHPLLVALPIAAGMWSFVAGTIVGKEAKRNLG